MSPRTKKFILTATAIAAVSAPALGASPVQARQGADDPVGHVRHSGTDDSVRSSSSKARSKHRSRTRTRSGRRGAHHGANHRRGADDGPNHS
ncbi:MAG TPA: hypothetical protein VMY78_00815 [Solirubrobacteraceae bacterium]|nr:hypothetical protein [Solirubrobacteraceae bacterium]